MRLQNEYFNIVTPFPVEVRVGVAESNVFIGSSMALQDLYETVTVRPGDQLHLLCGGDFLIRQGHAYEVFTRRRQAYEVMLHPGPRDPDLPFEHMERIDPANKVVVESYRERNVPIGQRIKVAP